MYAAEQEETTASYVVERLLSVGVRLAFWVEPLFPSLISFFLNRELRQLRTERRIGGYETKTQRLGRFHYRVDMDLILSDVQARHLFASSVHELSKIAGR